MKKEYEKPYIKTIEIKEEENIAEFSTANVQNGKTVTYGTISYNALNY